MPHRFASLSDRLTTRNGILLMGGSALAALLYTHGDVRHIVVMYSINVFLTFSLSMLGMGWKWFRVRKFQVEWLRRTALFGTGFALCATILAITIFEKFGEGGWITLVVTALVVALCAVIRRHYRAVESALKKLFRAEVLDLPGGAESSHLPLDPAAPTAAILVGSFGGLGLHTVTAITRQFPGQFRNLIFLSVGVIDSGEFKGEDAVAQLEAKTRETLMKYVALGRHLGAAADFRCSIATDVVPEANRLCAEVAREFPNTTFFAGKVIFHHERWFQNLLHNETALAVQRKLLEAGRTMVILPAVVR